MAGIKGQKWSTKRPPKKAQVHGSVAPATIKKIEKDAIKNNMSQNSWVGHIIEKYYEEA